MKRKRFTEEQIIGILKEQEAGVPVADLCRIMWEKRIHRIPIVRGAVLVGIISALDICRAVMDGAIEEEVVLTSSGAAVLTLFPAQELFVANKY